MMDKRIFLIIVNLCCIGLVRSQIPKEPGNVPSPQAWNFTQYGKTPISYFTGLPNISVNLDQVEQSGFKIPVSLNYNIASVKPDIHPGPTGLGWNHSMGGVVTRTVRGLTDEFYFQQDVNFENQGNQTYTYFNGYRNNSNSILFDVTEGAVLSTIPPVVCVGTILACGANNISNSNLRPIPQTLPYLWDAVTYMAPECWNGCTWYWLKNNHLTGGERSAAWNNSGGGIIDHSPDEFNFSVNGLSGKFYLPRGNTNVVTEIVCNKKVKITVSSINENVAIPSQLPVPPYNGPGGTADNWYYNMSPWYRYQSYPKTLAGFRIVDEEGNQYIFGRKDANDFDYQNAIEYGIDVYNINQDYWKADSWFLHQIVLFNGKTVNYEYIRGGFQTSMYMSSYDANVSSTVLSSFERYDRGGRFIYPSYLSKIYAEDFKISMNYSESVQLKYENNIPDLYSTKPNTPSVSIYNKIYDYVPNDAALKWLKLDQVIIQRNNAVPILHNFSYNNLSNQRLMLQGITTNDGTNNISNHQFFYNTSKTLPTYLTGQTDHWGYWNGKSPTSNNIATFTSDKAPDPEFLYAGVLNKIKYPTGGYSEFEYEPNEYGKIVQPNRTLNPSIVANTTGGGLRIKKISDYTQSGGSAFNMKEFIYKSGYNNTLSAFDVQQLPSSGVLNIIPQYSWTGTVPYFNFAGPGGNTTFIAASSQPLYYTTDDYQIGYSEVAEKNSDGSASVYNFSNHDNGYKDETYYQALNDIFNSPFTRYTSKSFERGLLLQQADYNNSGQLVHKKITTYKPSDATKPMFYDREASYFNNQAWTTGSTPQITLNKVVLFGTMFKRYKYISVPDLEEEYIYQDGTTTLKTSSQYFYENTALFNPTKIVTSNSKGEELTTIIKYAHDYPGNFMMQNIANSKPGTVLEKLELKKDLGTNNQMLTGGQLSEYGLSTGSNMPWLNSVYQLTIREPVAYSSYQATNPLTRNLNSSTMYSKDSRYSEVLKINAYDSRYNILDIAKRNGEKRRIVYGNRDNSVIASIISQTNYDAFQPRAYTSFEQYNYWDGEGYNLSEKDSENDFIYNGLQNTEAFSGKHSFNGRVKYNKQLFSAYLTVLAKQGGNAPILEWVSSTGTITSTQNFDLVGEKNGWNIYRKLIGATPTIQVNSNSNIIDELRITSSASDDLVTSYTYNNGVVSCVIDPNYNRIFYEYDALNRLTIIRDQNKNILKKYCYNYAGQVEDCNSPCLNSNANWQNTSTPLRCVISACAYTGYQEQEQQDMNTCSPTFGHKQWVASGYNPSACAGLLVQVSGINNTNLTGYTVVYTNVSTGIPVSFNIPPSSTTELGCLPAAVYNIRVYRSVGTPTTLDIWVGSNFISGSDVTFYNIPLNKFYKTVMIDFPW